MPTFIEATWRTHANLAHVRCIRDTRPKGTSYLDRSQPWTVLEMDDGSSVQAFDSPRDIIEESRPIVPNNSDIEVLLWAGNVSDGPIEFIRTPVIAWRIIGDAAEPIIPDGLLGCTYALLYPDGHVGFEDGYYDTMDAFRDELRAMWTAKQAERAAEAAALEAEAQEAGEALAALNASMLDDEERKRMEARPLTDTDVMTRKEPTP